MSTCVPGPCSRRCLKRQRSSSPSSGHSAAGNDAGERALRESGMIEFSQLQAICKSAPESRLILFVEPLNTAIEQFSIKRVPEFIAQVAHESGAFQWPREIWGPTPAQAAYEGRVDLGNTHPGDGFKFRGRGLIQVTGRANYAACAIALDLPLLDQPELLERPMVAARSAGWFWKAHKLDDVDDFQRMTRIINGGTNGLADRYAYLGHAREALGVA